MRILKIFLIIFLLFSVAGLSIVGVFGFVSEGDTSEGMVLVSFFAVGVLLGIITLYFHIRTFHYYRTSHQNKAVRKIHTSFGLSQFFRICSLYFLELLLLLDCIWIEKHCLAQTFTHHLY